MCKIVHDIPSVVQSFVAKWQTNTKDPKVQWVWGCVRYHVENVQRLSGCVVAYLLTYVCVVGYALLRIKPTRNSCYGNTCTAVQNLFVYYCSHTSPWRKGFFSEKALTVLRCEHWLTLTLNCTETSALQNRCPKYGKDKVAVWFFTYFTNMEWLLHCCDAVQQLFKHCSMAV